MTTPQSGIDLSQPQRQSPIAIIANLGNLNALQAFIPILAVGISRGLLVLGGLLLAGLLLVLALSTLSWKFTTYWVDNDHLVLQKGVLNRKRVEVPLDRIQQIATEQGIVQQIFNVRKVRVDSAGAAGSDVELIAITDPMVTELRQQLVGVDRAGFAAPPAGAAFDQSAPNPTAAHPATPHVQASAPPSGAFSPTVDRRTVVVHHTLADLARIALARPSAQVFAGVAAILSLGLGGAIERLFEGSAVGVTTALILCVVGLVLLVVAMIAGTVVQQFDLTIWRSDQGLRLTAGLFNKRELFARTERVQYVQRNTNILERLLQRTSVYLPQASATAGDTAATMTQRFWVPGIPTSKLAAVTDLFLPPDRPEPDRLVGPKAQWRWLLWGGLVPGVLIGLGGIATWVAEVPVVPWILGALAIGVIGWGLFASPRKYQNYRWNINHAALSRREGFINQERIDVACRKIQSVQVRQGWWHRRNELASVECGTAAGSFKILHLPLATANELRDELLYLVETNTQDWM